MSLSTQDSLSLCLLYKQHLLSLNSVLVWMTNYMVPLFIHSYHYLQKKMYFWLQRTFNSHMISLKIFGWKWIWDFTRIQPNSYFNLNFGKVPLLSFISWGTECVRLSLSLDLEGTWFCSRLVSHTSLGHTSSKQLILGRIKIFLASLSLSYCNAYLLIKKKSEYQSSWPLLHSFETDHLPF